MRQRLIFVTTMMLLLVNGLSSVQADTDPAPVREENRFGIFRNSNSRLNTGSAPGRYLKQNVLFASSSKESPKPTNLNHGLVLGLGISWGVSDFIFKDKLAPSKPRWTEPNVLDTTMREWLKCENTKTADTISDVLLFGVFLPSFTWTPWIYKEDEPYRSRLMIGAEAIAYNAVLNQIVKFSVGRQRPYSYFNDSDEGGDEYLSFYSGHASTSFSAATSAAYVLSDKASPSMDIVIWSSSLIVAASVAYLRVAADKHYFTDVLVGAVVGSAIGLVVARQRTKNWLERESNPQTAPSVFPPVFVFSKTFSF